MSTTLVLTITGQFNPKFISKHHTAFFEIENNLKHIAIQHDNLPKS